MKNKIYKKIGLLSISALAALSFSTQVKAEQVCEDVEYYNYYFFSGIFVKDDLDAKLTEDNSVVTTLNGTFFPALPTTINNNKVKETKYKRICLSLDDNNSECDDKDEIFPAETALEQFYDTYKLILKNKEKNKVTFKVDYDVIKDGVTTPFKGKDDAAYTITDSKNEKVNYYIHSLWFTINEQGAQVSETSDKIVRYDEQKNENLIGAAIIPSETSFTTDKNNAGDYAKRFDVTRKIQKSDKAKNTAYKAVVGDDETSYYLTPALLRVTFVVNECKEEQDDDPTPAKGKFTATIKYLDEDTKEAVANQYSEKDLPNGYKKSVESPDKDGCKLVKKDDVQVSYQINNDDFVYEVLYRCEVDDPGKTGNVLIFVAWVVGLSALGYSVYWFKKNKPEEVE